MITCPANEQRISDVERGLSCDAVIPLPPGELLAAGDTVLFAHSRSRAGQVPSYVSGGDSVLVSLTDVADLDEIDPATGHPLFHLRWERLGQVAPSASAPRRIGKPAASRSASPAARAKLDR